MSQPVRPLSLQPGRDQVYGGGETFGECLNRFMREKGVSQNQLSRGSTLDVSYISRLVNLPCDPLNLRLSDGYHVQIPSRDTVFKLAIGLDLDVLDTDDLLRAAGYVGLIRG